MCWIGMSKCRPMLTDYGKIIITLILLIKYDQALFEHFAFPRIRKDANTRSRYICALVGAFDILFSYFGIFAMLFVPKRPSLLALFLFCLLFLWKFCFKTLGLHTSLIFRLVASLIFVRDRFVCVRGKYWSFVYFKEICLCLYHFKEVKWKPICKTHLNAHRQVKNSVFKRHLCSLAMYNFNSVNNGLFKRPL